MSDKNKRLCIEDADCSVTSHSEGRCMTDMAAAGDDRDRSVSVEHPVQHSVFSLRCSLSCDHPDRLEVSGSEGQLGNEGWGH